MAENGAHAHIWAYVFWANWAGYFMGAQETIIYRLVMRNPSYDAYFPFDFLGQPLSRNHVSEIFRGEPPLKSILRLYKRLVVY